MTDQQPETEQLKPREMTPSEASASLRKIADEHEAWVGTASSPSEAGYHMARMLVMRTAADLLAAATPPPAKPCQECERLKAVIVKAHDLVSRSGQPASHDHEGCLIDGILNLIEPLPDVTDQPATPPAKYYWGTDPERIEMGPEWHKVEPAPPPVEDAPQADSVAKTCPDCNGTGTRYYAREVTDGCDRCNATGVSWEPAKDIPSLTPADLMALRDRCTGNAKMARAHAVGEADYKVNMLDAKADAWDECAEWVDTLLSRLDGHAQEQK